MPAMTNVALTDRESTPVTHTFKPRSLRNDVAELVNSSGVPIGDEKLTLSMKKQGSFYRGEARLLLPVIQTETISGIARPTVVRTAIVSINVSFPEGGTRQERDNAIGLAYALLSDGRAMVDETFVDLGTPF